MIDQLIIPCSGRGSRFAPYTSVPKPLIPIAGRPMLDWAVEGMRMPKKFDHAVVILHEDQVGHELSLVSKTAQRTLERVAETISVKVQRQERQGAAHSVLLAQPLLDSKKSVAVWNCDQWLPEWSRELPPDADGWILTFDCPEKNPKWSYVATGPDGYVTRVAEKEPISTEATVGAYFYREARDLFWACEEAIRGNVRVNGEFYLAPTFNHLIQIGRKILPVRTEDMEGLGTPEDLDAFVLKHRLPDWRKA